MNNNEKQFMNEDNLDVNRLYDIASKLRESQNEMTSYEKIIAQNPGHIIREIYFDAYNRYKEAIQDLNILLNS